MPEEVWYKIPGHQFYLASNIGNIKSLPRNIYRRNGVVSPLKERILKKHLGKLGYYTVGVNGKTTMVHILICLSFHGERTDSKFVEHLDDNRLNNIPENLKWSTQKENIASAIRNNKLKLGESASWSKLKNVDILKIRSDPRIHKIIAKDYLISRQTVGDIKNRRIWKHISDPILT